MSTARVLETTCVALALAIVFAHAGLIPAGHWAVDEFHDLGLFRTSGFAYFWERLFTWSPRPFSETLIGGYFFVTEWTRRSLIAPALALLWLLLAAAFAPFVIRGRGASRRPRLLLGSATLAMFLLGHRLSEMFYWTLGAVAYLTALAGITLLTLQFVDGRSRPGRGQRTCILAALAVAGSAEIGAVFTFVLSLAMLALGLTRRSPPRRIWLLPLAVASLILLALALGRGRLEEHVFYLGRDWNPALLGHPLASLLRAIPTIARQLAGLDATATGADQLAWGLAIKAAFFLAALACLQRLPTIVPTMANNVSDRAALQALLFTLLATFSLSIIGAYYKFGVACCERHDTLRQCLLLLAELVAAALLAGFLTRRLPPTFGPALLAAALLALSAQRWHDLHAAYAASPAIHRAWRTTWASGTAPGDHMTFRIPAPDPLIGGFVPPERASYPYLPDTPWLWRLVMDYFQKRSLQTIPEPP